MTNSLNIIDSMKITYSAHIQVLKNSKEELLKIRNILFINNQNSYVIHPIIINLINELLTRINEQKQNVEAAQHRGMKWEQMKEVTAKIKKKRGVSIEHRPTDCSQISQSETQLSMKSEPE